MIRQALFTLLLAATVVTIFGASDLQAQQTQQAYGRQWGHSYNTQDWNRFYHYPYVYYPQNYYGPDYYKSSDSLYYRYPKEMQIPVYNRQWHNFLPEGHKYHSGHHFQLDVF